MLQATMMSAASSVSTLRDAGSPAASSVTLKSMAAVLYEVSPPHVAAGNCFVEWAALGPLGGRPWKPPRPRSRAKALLASFHPFQCPSACETMPAHNRDCECAPGGPVSQNHE